MTLTATVSPPVSHVHRTTCPKVPEPSTSFTTYLRSACEQASSSAFRAAGASKRAEAARSRRAHRPSLHGGDPPPLEKAPTHATHSDVFRGALSPAQRAPRAAATQKAWGASQRTVGCPSGDLPLAGAALHDVADVYNEVRVLIVPPVVLHTLLWLREARPGGEEPQALAI